MTPIKREPSATPSQSFTVVHMLTGSTAVTRSTQSMPSCDVSTLTPAGEASIYVIASLNGEPVGQTWGWPLDQERAAGWWNGLVEEPEPEFTVEDGKRTFALSEIMIRRPYTGQHFAHALHDELLNGRHETRATLLVNPTNETAYRIYLRWGWHKTAQLRPAWPDAPMFDVLMLPLPIVR